MSTLPAAFNTGKRLVGRPPPGKPKTPLAPSSVDTPAAGMTRPTDPKTSAPKRTRKPQTLAGPPASDGAASCTLVTTSRQWMLSAQWVLLLTAIVWLPVLVPWWTCAPILPLLLVVFWLYSLVLAGLRPPEALVRLDIVRFVGHAFDSARCLAIRALGGESKGKGLRR